jgi:uncharacterized protein
MIAYLDASAIVKLYISEEGSELVRDALSGSETAGTSIISRAEVAAAIAKAVRVRIIPKTSAQSALRRFSNEWTDLLRLPLSEALVTRAASLAWDHHLRGYDSVQLASALAFSEMLGRAVTMITFDRPLAQSAANTGLDVLPTS